MSGDARANRKLLASQELPPCDGPKLGAFEIKRPSIEWLEPLENPSSEGYVFKVKIESKVYALKVFKFFKPATERHLLDDITGKNVTDEMLAFHTDPFYAECRAYGLIQESERKRRRGFQKPMAANCHGFLPLSRRDELVLARKGIDLWKDIPEDEEYRRRAQGSPVRAIVKDFIEPELAIDLAVLRRILANVRSLNRLGILHWDIRASNFKAGLLVDFGSSWTEPHCIMDAVPTNVSEEWWWTDLVMFDDMVEELGFSLDNIRARPNPAYLEKLRSWDS
ncbi:Kinetochore Sim4 complex subunit FTA2 domain containing protein [Rhypophila sp. PSN 637]